MILRYTYTIFIKSIIYLSLIGLLNNIQPIKAHPAHNAIIEPLLTGQTITDDEYYRQLGANNKLDIGIFESPIYPGKVVIKIKPVNFDLKATDRISSILYTVKWPAEYGNIDLTTDHVYPYCVSKEGDPELYNGYYYQVFASTCAARVGAKINAGEELVISGIKFPEHSCVVFELADDDWTTNNNGGPYFAVWGTPVTGEIYEDKVEFLPVGGTVSGSKTIKLGENTGTLTLEDFSGAVITWQKRFNDGIWEDINGTAGETEYSGVPDKMGTWEYRAKVKRTNCPAEYSDEAVITVEEAEIGERTVTFIVTDQDDEPVEGATITITENNDKGYKDNGNNNGIILTTDFEGKASTALEDGTYTVEIFHEGFIEKTIDELTVLGVDKTREITLNESTLTIKLEEKTDITCFGDHDGTITILVENGISPIVFEWTGPDEFTSAIQNLDKLAPGTYTLTVTDGNSCTDQLTVTIFEPDELTVSLDLKTDVTCYGWSDGAITLFDPEGGTGICTYNWTKPGGFFADTRDLVDLFAGTYSLIVTDENFCEAFFSVIVEEPDDFTVTVFSDQTICNETEPARLTTTASGGTGSYSYQWFEDEADDGTWNEIDGATSGQYQPDVLEGSWFQLNRYHYMLMLTDDQCGVITDDVTITVNPPLPPDGDAPPEEPDFPDYTEVTGTDEEGYHCYEALVTVTVEDYTAEAGSEVNIIAGQNITIPPGTHLKHGSYVYMGTTDNCTFCRAVELMGSEKNMLAVGDDLANSDEPFAETTEMPVPGASGIAFNVYPNPSRDRFTIDLFYTGENTDAQVMVFGLKGELIHETSFAAAEKHTFDLSGYQPGIYIVRVVINNSMKHKRIIRQ